MGGFRVGIVDEIGPAPRDGRRQAARDRGRQHEARQEGRAAAEGHDGARPAALGARPEVRRADARQEQRDARGRRHDPAGNAGDAGRVRRLCSTPSTRDARRTRRTRSRASATPSPAAAQSINARSRRFGPFFMHLTPVMATLSDPAHGARRVLQADRPRVRPRSPRSRDVQARAVREHGRHVRGDRPRPGALQATIEKSPADARRPAIRVFRVQRPFLADFADLSRGCARPRRAPTACRDSTTRSWSGTPVLRRRVKLNEVTDDVSRRSTTSPRSRTRCSR